MAASIAIPLAVFLLGIGLNWIYQLVTGDTSDNSNSFFGPIFLVLHMVTVYGGVIGLFISSVAVLVYGLTILFAKEQVSSKIRGAAAVGVIASIGLYVALFAKIWPD